MMYNDVGTSYTYEHFLSELTSSFVSDLDLKCVICILTALEFSTYICIDWSNVQFVKQLVIIVFE